MNAKLLIANLGQNIEIFEFADGTEMTAQQIIDNYDPLMLDIPFNIVGTNDEDTLLGRAASETLSGLDDADILRGGGGNDTLFGGEGRDQLYGGDGNDTLDVGTNDQGRWQHVQGGNGDDTYVFSANSGLVYINSGEGIDGGDADQIIFTDFNSEDLDVSFSTFGSAANGTALVLSNDALGQEFKLLVSNQGEYIEKFVFADGQELTWEDFNI